MFVTTKVEFYGKMGRKDPAGLHVGVGAFTRAHLWGRLGPTTFMKAPGGLKCWGIPSGDPHGTDLGSRCLCRFQQA